jgi:hypothetical protein
MHGMQGGQGFKSPQLHRRSEAKSGPDWRQVPGLGQQIGSSWALLRPSGGIELPMRVSLPGLAFGMAPASISPIPASPSSSDRQLGRNCSLREMIICAEVAILIQCN